MSDWVLNKLEEFGPFLGMSLNGLENEITELFKLIELQRTRRMRGVEDKSAESKRLKNELKKLEFYEL